MPVCVGARAGGGGACRAGGGGGRVTPRVGAWPFCTTHSRTVLGAGVAGRWRREGGTGVVVWGAGHY